MKLLTNEEFINKANKIHNNKYTYKKTEYKNRRSDVRITCPIHGDFVQQAGRHIQGHGCSKCKRDKIRNDRTGLLSDFLTAVSKKGYEHITFNHEDFKGMTTPVLFSCTEHGNFTIPPWRLLSNVKGCPKCGRTKAHHPTKTDVPKLIDKMNKVHNYKYDYSKMIFTKMKQQHTIVCPVHGEFQQRLTAHLKGTGCPSCASGGFDPKKPGYVYYLSLNDGQAYKIGITNRSVKERFNLTELSKITVIWTKYFENGQDCWDTEKRILNEYRQYKYVGNPLLESGNTELFSIDIFNLPKEV